MNEFFPLSIPGGMQDYTYRVASGYEILIELSCCKYPHDSELRRYWQENREALINYLMQVHIGQYLTGWGWEWKEGKEGGKVGGGGGGRKEARNM